MSFSCRSPASILLQYSPWLNIERISEGVTIWTCLRAMPEPTLQDVQRYLANYLNGEISLSQFRDWFDTETWDLDMQPDTSLGQMVGEIELRLAEFTSGHRTEDDLRAVLQPLLQREPVTKRSWPLSFSFPLKFWR